MTAIGLDRRHGAHDGRRTGPLTGELRSRPAGSWPRRRRRTARRIDLGGACVLPGFTDATCTSRPGRRPRARSASRARGRSRRRWSASPRAARAAAGRRAGCAAWAGAPTTGTPPAEPTASCSTASRPGVPVALMSRDYHSLWVSSDGARAGRRRPARAGRRGGGRRGRRADRRPARDVGVDVPRPLRARRRTTSTWRRMRAALPRRRARGVTADPRQGRLARRARAVPAPARRRAALTLRVWQSVPHERLDELAGARPALRLRRRPACASATSRRSWTARSGSRTARLLDGIGRRDHQRARRSRTIVAPGRRAPASRSRCTRSATRPTATRSTRSRRPATCGRRAACASASSTRSCSRPRTSARFAALGRHGVRAVQPRAVGPRPRRPRCGRATTDRAYAYRSLLDAGARARQRLRRARSRSSTRWRACAPASGARSTTGRRGTPSSAVARRGGAAGHRRSRRPGSRATSTAAAASSPGCSPTSSSSTATR